MKRYAKDFDPCTRVVENCKYMDALGRIQDLERRQSMMEYTGNVVLMGDMEYGSKGLVIEIRPQVFISLVGFAQHDVTAMPNLLYKNVKITVEVINE